MKFCRNTANGGRQPQSVTAAFYEKLREHTDWLDGRVGEMERRLSDAPEGHLVICSERGHSRCYRSKPNDFRREYLNCEKEHLAQRLAQKGYDEKALPLLKKELATCKGLLALNAPCEIDAAFRGLSQARRNLVIPVDVPDGEFRSAWEAEEYTPKPIDSANAFSTAKGDFVRSKSEVIIANSLYAADIPYRYECPLYLESIGIVHPDFTVLNVRTREVFYWEHLGMMDDEEYCNKAIRRIAAYEIDGLIENRRLLTTMESRSCPLNTKLIEMKIQAFLL